MRTGTSPNPRPRLAPTAGCSLPPARLFSGGFRSIAKGFRVTETVTDGGKDPFNKRKKPLEAGCGPVYLYVFIVIIN